MSFTRRSFFAFLAGIPAAVAGVFKPRHTAGTVTTELVEGLRGGTVVPGPATCLVTITGLPCNLQTLGEVQSRFPGMEAFTGWYVPTFVLTELNRHELAVDSGRTKTSFSSVLLYGRLDDLLSPDLVEEVWNYSPAGFARQPDQRPLNTGNRGGCGKKLFDPDKLYWSKAEDGRVW